MTDKPDQISKQRRKRGRVAYQFDEYMRLAGRKVLSIEQAMDAIPNKRSKEWCRLRKQYLVYKERIANRKHKRSVEQLTQATHELLLGTLATVKKMVSTHQYNQIIKKSQERLPVLFN